MTAAPKLLTEILKKAEEADAAGDPFLAVFDLDSTLFDLSLRVQRILEHFTEDPKICRDFPEACEKLKNLKILSTDWGIDEGLQRAALHREEHPEFFEQIHAFWRHWFFSSDFLHQDSPLPGAVEFVLALEERNALIWYLTGRDVGRMEKGTRQSLKHWGFPLDQEHTELILKPDPELDDALFKLEILREASEEFPHIWLFENEPVNLNLIQKNLPLVQLVMIESTHSRREEADARLARIPHFEIPEKDFLAFLSRQKSPQGRKGR